MPKRALYSDAFGELVRKVLGDLTNEKAAEIAGMSPESIRRMRNNKVLEESTVERLIKAFPQADGHAIRIAAGYEKPDVDEIFKGVYVTLDANSQGLTEDNLKNIRESLERARKKLR